MTDQYVSPSRTQLTARQLECLDGFWNRKRPKEIAVELGISESAVHKHFLAIREKLGVSSIREAMELVYGDVHPPSKMYQSIESDVHSLSSPTHYGHVSGSSEIDPDMASEQLLINKLGPAATLLAIVGVGIGSVIGVAALVAAAEGMTKIWGALPN